MDAIRQISKFRGLACPIQNDQNTLNLGLAPVTGFTRFDAESVYLSNRTPEYNIMLNSVNALAPGTCDCYLRLIIFKLILRMDIF